MQKRQSHAKKTKPRISLLRAGVLFHSLLLASLSGGSIDHGVHVATAFINLRGKVAQV